MTPYKLQILQEEEDYLYWNDFYLDMDAISGFYIVAEPELIQGELVSLKPEPHLEKYLMERFVNPCVEI